MAMRLRSWYIKEAKSGGQYDSGTWSNGQITAVFVNSKDKPPKMPAEAFQYRLYVDNTRAQVVKEMTVSIKPPYSNLRLATSADGKWCWSCNGFKCKTGCKVAKQTASFEERKEKRNKRGQQLIDLGDTDARDNWFRAIKAAVDELCDSGTCKVSGER